MTFAWSLTGSHLSAREMDGSFGGMPASDAVASATLMTRGRLCVYNWRYNGATSRVSRCRYAKIMVVVMIMMMVTSLWRHHDAIHHAVLAAPATTRSTGLTIEPMQRMSSSPSLLRKSFRWTASVDVDKGLAFSKEVSIVSIEKGNKQIQNRHNDRFMQNVIIHTLESYPQWLCQASVTIGLLQAIPRVGGSYEIRTRCWGLNVLTFDRPHRQWYSFDPFMTRRRRKRRWSADTVSLPILGGLMAATGPDPKGRLKFTVAHPKNHANGGGTKHLIITTEIDRYRPMLLGKEGGWTRAQVYRHTQSVVHAYVMWRFHHHILQQLQLNKCI